MNALEKYEINDLEKSEVLNSNEGWSISSLESADWALRKISALKSANEEINQLANREHERINEWETKETQSNKDSIEFFEHKLSEYLYLLRQNDPKAKIKTPHGTVSTRKQQDSWEFSDEAIESLKKQGYSEYIQTTETINKKAFKKDFSALPDGRVISENGEIIEVVKVISQGEKVIVKEV